MPGYYITEQRIKENATPIDNVVKFAWDDEDYEAVEVWHEYTEDELSFMKEAEFQSRVATQTAVAVQLCVLQANLSDEQALQVEALYPEWKVDSSYVIGDIRRYNDDLYRSLQASTGAAEHTPDIATSLWKKILPATEPGGYLPWVQPLGATDAYNTGDKVTHNDKTWESACDNNVWEPGVYGWTEVTE